MRATHFRREIYTADGIFTLRQLVEKRLERQENMALGIIDLKNAYHADPREIVMASLRWTGVPEARMMTFEGTRDDNNGRVVRGTGMSEQFRVNVENNRVRRFAVVERVDK